ncbi:class I SAM-dependent methyltransferase [Agromyces silvae]|uniref:class I SAM-dependent methyltransferase n=1 Tax=Agromyces silvae TaxID=3388266 RepID=UPI00280B4202|nr:class I SAM-dependent methyltransferase [Agromyces protaetiae]
MTTQFDATDAQAFAGRLFASTLGAFEMASVYLGERLGWYRSLATDGPATAAELARRTGTDARYAREWLEQQATSGILSVERDADDGERRRYELPAAHAEVLTDSGSLNFLAPLARMIGAVRLPELAAVYRTGDGISWNDFGDDGREAQADINRPWFEQRLGEALASVPDLDRMLARPGARFADVGCGYGWSSVALARAYPEASVEGFDVDAPSVEAARRTADAADLADRVRFHLAGGEEIAERERSAQGEGFDAAFIFEALHDMPFPVEVLRSIRAALRPGAPLVVMDEAVAERFTPNGDETERVMYGYSLFICLPDSRSAEGSAATGTVMRPATLARYASEAGFADVEILPIDDFAAFRFYALT